MTGSEEGRIVGKRACWCVTGSEEGRIVGRRLLVCDRVRRGKDSREEAVGV